MDRDDERLFSFELALKLGVPHPDLLAPGVVLEAWKTWLDGRDVG